MKVKFVLAIILLAGFSASAQFQLRPIMIKVSPFSYTYMDLNPNTTKWIDENYSNIGSVNPAGVGFSMSVFVPVVKSLWFGCSYSNSAYYKNGGYIEESNNYYNNYPSTSDTSGYIQISDNYHLQKLTSYSIGFQWRPGHLNKSIVPYFNILYTMQFIKQSGYTRSETKNLYVEQVDTTSGFYNSYYSQYYYMNTSTEIIQPQVYNSLGLTLGMGLDIRLSQHILLNLFEINGSNLSGSNNHAFCVNVKSGVTILLLKKK